MTSLTSARSERAYEPHEVLLSIAFSTGMVVSFFMLLVVAGQSAAKVQPQEPPPPAAIPISVKPVLDELPLLKQGGKKLRPKLPDMWKKNPPVQRYEAASAPSPKAAKTPEAAASTLPLVKPDASAPPPDAEVAKEVDQVLLDAGPDAEPVVEGEGAPDGVKEGTETDPLKARALDAYRAKILAFLNRRFVAPSPEEAQVPCDEAKKLRAAATVTIGADRQIVAFSLTSASGNAVFDARVQSALSGMVGEQLPPPPPLYPDLQPGTITPTYSGSNLKCE